MQVVIYINFSNTYWIVKRVKIIALEASRGRFSIQIKHGNPFMDIVLVIGVMDVFIYH